MCEANIVAREGENAFDAGKGIDDNPYDMETQYVDWYNWRMGFKMVSPKSTVSPPDESDDSSENN